ncbi:MAG: hypothetical protein GQ531_11675 [Sulfurovum sp.]|nr:hypothetical protein [Sulfurovum sp.]
MEKIVNINKAPKDDVLNQIMQEIDDENVSATDTTPPKNKKTPKIKKPPKKKSWTRWLVYFIFLLMIVAFLFVLVLIVKATKEVTHNAHVKTEIIEKVEENRTSTIALEKNVIYETDTKAKVVVKALPKKVPDNLIIFDMKAKKPDIPIEQAPYVAKESVEKVATPLTEREKAKALLKEQMGF